MIIIENLNEKNIYDPYVSADIFEFGKELVNNSGGYKNVQLAGKLQELINIEDDSSNIIDKEYKDLIVKLKFASLHSYTEKAVIELFRKGLKVALNDENIDIKDKIKGMMLIYEQSYRDIFKEKLRKAMHLNEERITERYLTINGKQEQGTIGNWIADYINFVGGGRVESLKLAEYFTSSNSMKGTSVEDIEKVKKLVGLYEYLKISSMSLEGMEEDLLLQYEGKEDFWTIDKNTGLGLKLDIKGGKKYTLKKEEVKAIDINVAEDPVKELTKHDVGVTLPKGVDLKTYEKIERSHTSQPIVPVKTQPVVPMKPAVVSHEGHPLRQELDEIVEDVISKVNVGRQNLEPWDDVLKKRFKTIVSSRLRDVRDKSELISILLKDKKIGGMGAREDEAEGIANVVEKEFNNFQVKWKDVEKKKEQEWREKQKELKESREVIKTKEDEEDLKIRYERLTGKKVQEEVKPLMQVKPEIPIEPVQKSLPRKPVIPAPTPKPEAKRVVIKEDMLPRKPKPVSPPPKPVPPPPKKMADVKVVQRLTGPIEELSGLTLMDFKRIAKSPEESTKKILEKVDRLKAESLTRGSDAISAWRKSPLHQLYSAIMGIAIAKKMSPEVAIKQREQEGKQSLTLDEFYAIMELNQKLRF